MGVNIKAFRLALILVSSILSACVTAFAGPVSFVGIAVPQLVKSLFKNNKADYYDTCLLFRRGSILQLL